MSHDGVILLLIVQAKVSRFPVNPNTFCTLLEKVYLYKQQNMKSPLKETVIQSLQECITKTDMVIYLITLYSNETGNHVLKNYHKHSLCRIFHLLQV